MNGLPLEAGTVRGVRVKLNGFRLAWSELNTRSTVRVFFLEKGRDHHFLMCRHTRPR